MNIMQNSPGINFPGANTSSAVLAARNFNEANSIQETGVQIREA